MQTQVYSIDEIREIVAPIAKQHGVDKVFLFGSYARGDALQKSIDVVTTGSLKYNKDEAFLENLRKDRVLLYELS